MEKLKTTSKKSKTVTVPKKATILNTVTQLVKKVVYNIFNVKRLNKNSSKSLHMLAGINRAVVPNHVTKLAHSVSMMGVIRPVVVAEISFLDGITKTYIIDGQHLFHALLRLNYDIPIVYIHITDKKDLIEKIALLNASSKTWSLIDYVTAWQSINPDYVTLYKLFNTYDFDISTIAGIMCEKSISGGTNSKLVKSGEFKIENYNKNKIILDYLTDLFKVIPRMTRMQNKYVCNEYVNFVRKSKSYNHTRFLTNLKKNKRDFILATQEEDKLSQMFKKLA
jgi:hypothetical protein